MSKALCRSDDRLSREHSGANNRDRHQVIEHRAIAELPGAAVAPSHQAITGPAQHQIVPIAAVVVGHKWIKHPSISQKDKLALRQVVQRSHRERKPGILHHHQHRARDRRVVQSEDHAFARRRKTRHSRRDFVSVAVGCINYVRAGAAQGDVERVGSRIIAHDLQGRILRCEIEWHKVDREVRRGSGAEVCGQGEPAHGKGSRISAGGQNIGEVQHAQSRVAQGKGAAATNKNGAETHAGGPRGQLRADGLLNGKRGHHARALQHKGINTVGAVITRQAQRGGAQAHRARIELNLKSRAVAGGNRRSRLRGNDEVRSLGAADCDFGRARKTERRRAGVGDGEGADHSAAIHANAAEVGAIQHARRGGAVGNRRAITPNPDFRQAARQQHHVVPGAADVGNLLGHPVDADDGTFRQPEEGPGHCIGAVIFDQGKGRTAGGHVGAATGVRELQGDSGKIHRAGYRKRVVYGCAGEGNPQPGPAAKVEGANADVGPAGRRAERTSRARGDGQVAPGGEKRSGRDRDAAAGVEVHRRCRRAAHGRALRHSPAIGIADGQRARRDQVEFRIGQAQCSRAVGRTEIDKLSDGPRTQGDGLVGRDGDRAGHAHAVGREGGRVGGVDGSVDGQTPGRGDGQGAGVNR